MANTLNVGGIGTKDVGTKSHLISTTITKEDFENNTFLALKNGGDPSDSKNYTANVPIKVWNGGYSVDKATGKADKTKVANETVNLPINFAKMSNAFVAVTKEQPALATDPLNPDKTPVQITRLVDKGTNAEKYAISIDPNATATANAQQHYDASQEALNRGEITQAMSKAQLEKGKERLNVDMRLNTTYKSVAGINDKAIEANIGKIATQHYIFNPKFAGDKDAVKAIQEATAKVSADYTKFLKDNFEAAITSKKGLPNLKSVSKAEGKTGTEIQGTAIGAFPGEIKAVPDGDGTRYVIKNDPDKKADVNNWFKDLNNRLGRQWKQEVFNTYGENNKSIENRLAGSIKPQMYSVNPQDSKAIVVQPGMVASFAPFVSSFVSAYDAATHGRDIPEPGEKVADRSKATQGDGWSVAQVYKGKEEFVANAEKLSKTYTDMADSLKAKDQTERTATLNTLESKFPEADKQLGE